MKKLTSFFLLCLVVAANIFSSCTDYSDDIKKLQEQIDALKYEQINTVNDQIASIKASLGTLQITDKELQLYITQLQIQQEELEKTEKELSAKIDEAASNPDFASLLKEYKALVDEQIESLKSAIKALQEKDKELQSQIDALQGYIDSGIKDAKDWVSATFATLEQYNTTATIVATIQAQIQSINSDISLLKNVTAAVSKDELDKAITSSETSIKNWVSDLLGGYYTAEETDAKIAALKEEIRKTGGNADLESLLKDYEDKLAETKKEVTEAYTSAITKAINDYDGIITARLAAEISAVNGIIASLRSDVKALDARMTSLENRVAKLEELVNKLINGDLDEDEDEETDISFPGCTQYEAKAKARYFGHKYSDEADDYVLYIYLGEYDADGNFVDMGTELALDILCKPSDEMMIPAGTYTCSQTDDITPGHILKGVEEDGYLYPSFFYRQYSTENSTIDLVTSAKAEVSSSGDKYTIKVYFSTDSDSYVWRYEGPIEFIDETSGSGDDVPKDVKIEKFSRATVQNLGAIWTDASEQTIPVDDWMVTLYGENYNIDNEYVTIEILSEKDAKSLPTGKFDEFINVSSASASVFKSGSIIGGYADGNIPYGTWYCKGGTAYYTALEGTLNIKEKDGVYTVDFAFTDTDETYGGSFSGCYTGKLETVNSYSNSAACAYAPAFRNTPATRSQPGIIRQGTDSGRPMRNAAAARVVTKLP